MKKFLFYKDVWFTILSFWLTLAILSILGSIFDMADELGLGIVLSVISLPLLIKAYPFYRKQVTEKGKQFFFSRVGYIVLGIILGLVSVSTIFNLAYESGWFNFTDLGFFFLSYPLILFTPFQLSSEIFLEKLLLYLILFVNLVAVVFVLDILGFLCVKLCRIIRNINVK